MKWVIDQYWGKGEQGVMAQLDSISGNVQDAGNETVRGDARGNVFSLCFSVSVMVQYDRYAIPLDRERGAVTLPRSLSPINRPAPVATELSLHLSNSAYRVLYTIPGGGSVAGRILARRRP